MLHHYVLPLLLKDLTLKIKMTGKIFGLVIEKICSSIRNQNMTKLIWDELTLSDTQGKQSTSLRNSDHSNIYYICVIYLYVLVINSNYIDNVKSML